MAADTRGRSARGKLSLLRRQELPLPPWTLSRAVAGQGGLASALAAVVVIAGRAESRDRGGKAACGGQVWARTDQAEADRRNGAGGRSCAHRVRRAWRRAWSSWLT
jgi:hypothetical protein